MDKKIYNSAELFEKLDEIRNFAKDAIVSILRSHNVKSVDFTLDQDGKNFDDDGYDEDFVYDNRVWVECYGKYGNEQGYVNEVSIDDNDNIIISAEGEEGNYPNDYVSHYMDNYIDILEKIEFMANNGII